MADEIIKLIENITGNSIVKGAFIVYIVSAAIVVLMVVAVFAFAFRSISISRKRWK